MPLKGSTRVTISEESRLPAQSQQVCQRSETLRLLTDDAVALDCLQGRVLSMCRFCKVSLQVLTCSV